MALEPLFAGLVVDEFDNAVSHTFVGSELCYVVDDAGFKRHISAEKIDRQVLDMMRGQIDGNEDLLGEQAAKMLGQDDIFSRAMIGQQHKNIDKQFDELLKNGIPAAGRSYMGMLGFKVIVNMHGDVIRFEQPEGQIDEE